MAPTLGPRGGKYRHRRSRDDPRRGEEPCRRRRRGRPRRLPRFCSTHWRRAGPISRCANGFAQKAFARTAVYDAAISNWMADAIGDEAPPIWRAFGGRLVQALRYGENPHQQRGLLRRRRARGWPCRGPGSPRRVRCRASRSPTTTSTTPMAPSSSSRNLRAGRRWRSSSTPIPAASPRATRSPRPTGWRCAAIRCPPSAASSHVNGRLDAAAATAITGIFTEVIVAPDADDDAIAIVASKPNLRLLLTGALPDKPGARLDDPPRRRRVFGAGSRRRGGRRPGAQGRDPPGADRVRTRRPALRLRRCQARQVERHRLRQGRGDRRDRRRPDEPGRRVADGRPQGARGGESRRVSRNRSRKARWSPPTPSSRSPTA